MDVSYRRDKDHNYMILMLRGTDRRGISGTDAGWKSYSSFIKMQSPDDGRKSGLFYEVTGMQPMFRVFEKKADQSGRNG